MPLDAQHASADDLHESLLNMASFIDSSLCQNIATLHANNFFHASCPSGHISMDTAASAPWSQLPPDWQDWITRQEVLPEHERRDILRQLAKNSVEHLVSRIAQC